MYSIKLAIKQDIFAFIFSSFSHVYFQDEEPVDNLSAAELLKRHIKHAKKVRAR